MLHKSPLRGVWPTTVQPTLCPQLCSTVPLSGLIYPPQYAVSTFISVNVFLIGPLYQDTGVWSQVPSVLRPMSMSVATEEEQTQLLNLSPHHLSRLRVQNFLLTSHCHLPPLLVDLLCLRVGPEGTPFHTESSPNVLQNTVLHKRSQEETGQAFLCSPPPAHQYIRFLLSRHISTQLQSSVKPMQ